MANALRQETARPVRSCNAVVLVLFLFLIQSVALQTLDEAQGAVEETEVQGKDETYDDPQSGQEVISESVAEEKAPLTEAELAPAGDTSVEKNAVLQNGDGFEPAAASEHGDGDNEVGDGCQVSI